MGHYASEMDGSPGPRPDQQPRMESYPTPEEVIASVIADGRTAGPDGVPRIGRMTRKKAHEVTKALREAGWRILR